MSRQLASSGMIPLSIDTCSKKISMSDTLIGFITPPDSPAPGTSAKVLQDANSRRSPDSKAPGEAQSAMLYRQSCSCASTPSSVTSTVGSDSPLSSAATDLSNVSEDIYCIIEEAAEQKIADAIAPLRLNLQKMESLTSHLHRENADLSEQNDTMSRQLDLHYRRIEQHTETFHSMLETESKSIQATTSNVAMTANLIGHLSQLIVNLPIAINQVVHNAVQQQTEMAFNDILQAQREFILAIQDMRQDCAASATSSEGSTTPRSSSDSSSAGGWRGRLLTDGVDKPTSYNPNHGSKGSFRRTLRRLLKGGQ